MGYTGVEAVGALRLSLGRATTDAEVSEACQVVPSVIAAIRDGSVAQAADPLGARLGA
jgi:cysteine sulfinate desulfinase/cysteine desulfurase-like protein